MLIVPAIDLLGGRCARLVKGDYERSIVYEADPVEVAKRFESEGARLIHVVDLDGAKKGRIVNLSIVEQLVKGVSVPVQLGGGMRSPEEVRRALEAGVARVVASTACRVEEGTRALLEVAGDRLVVSIDIRGSEAVVSGWTEGTGLSPVEWAKSLERWGVRRLVVTDTERDGNLEGPNPEAVRPVLEAVSVPILYAGGIAALEHIGALLPLEPLGLEGVIVGRVIHEGRFSLKEAVSRFEKGKNWRQFPQRISSVFQGGGKNRDVC